MSEAKGLISCCIDLVSKNRACVESDIPPPVALLQIARDECFLLVPAESTRTESKDKRHFPLSLVKLPSITQSIVSNCYFCKELQIALEPWISYYQAGNPLYSALFVMDDDNPPALNSSNVHGSIEITIHRNR